MTRKTGKMAVKARQLARSAKVAKYKRELSQAGVVMSLPRPSKQAMKEKEEELKKLYRELFPGQEGEKEQDQTGEKQNEEQGSYNEKLKKEEEPNEEDEHQENDEHADEEEQ